MSCPTELEWSMHVDAALTAAEAARLESHLSACAACRALVSALEMEARTLRSLMAEEDAATAIPALRASSAPRGYVAAAGVLIALASSSLVLGKALGSLRWPESLAWLNPFTRSSAIELVVSALVFIATEGRSMLISTIETAAAAVMIALLVAAALAAARRGGGGAAAFSVALMALALSGQSQALEIRRSDNLVSIPAAETVDDTLIALGQSIEIDGTVTGDLIAFGQRVVIRGTVAGQLVTGARTVVVEGDLGGSVLGFAETLTFAGGVIDRDLYGFARQLTSGDDVEIRGNAIVFASNASFEGPVGKDVLGFAGEIDVGGAVGGDLTAHAGAVRVLADARIDGDVVAHVGNENALQVSPGATIVGSVRTELDADRDRETRGPAARTGSFLAREAVSFGAAFLTGLILLWLVPPIARMSLDTAGETVTSAGIGLVTLVAVPIIAIMTGITLIGLPVAILALLAWVAALYLAKIVVAHFIGRKLFERASRPAHFALALLVGLLLVFVVINVPVLGGLVNFLLTITGLGMLVIYIWGMFQDRPLHADGRADTGV